MIHVPLLFYVSVKFRLTRFVLKCVNVSIICDNYRYFTLHTLPLQTILWLFLHCKAIYDNEKTHQCIKVVISTANTTRFDNPSNTFEGIWVGRFCSRNRRHRTHEVCLSIRRWLLWQVQFEPLKEKENVWLKIHKG